MRILMSFLIFTLLYISWHFGIVSGEKKNRETIPSILNHKSEQVCYFSPVYGPTEDISGEINSNEQITCKANRSKREDIKVSDDNQRNSRGSNSYAQPNSREDYREHSGRRNYRNYGRGYRQLRRKHCCKNQENGESNLEARTSIDTESDVNIAQNTDGEIRKDRSTDIELHTSSATASASSTNLEAHSEGVGLASASSASSSTNIEISTNIDDVLEAIKPPVQDKIVHLDTNIDISSGSSLSVNKDAEVGAHSGSRSGSRRSSHSRTNHGERHPDSCEYSEEDDYEYPRQSYRNRYGKGRSRHRHPEHEHRGSAGSRTSMHKDSHVDVNLGSRSGSRHRGYHRRPHEVDDDFYDYSEEDYSDEYDDYSQERYLHGRHRKHPSHHKKHRTSLHTDKDAGFSSSTNTHIASEIDIDVDTDKSEGSRSHGEHYEHRRHPPRRHGLSSHADTSTSSSSHSDFHAGRGLSTSADVQTSSASTIDMNNHGSVSHRKNYHHKNPWDYRHSEDYLEDRAEVCEEICEPQLNAHARYSSPHPAEPMNSHDNSPYVCGDYRNRLYDGNNPICPVCGKPDFRLKKRSLSADKRIYHFDSLKNSKGSDNEDVGIEQEVHYLNLDANCSGPASFINPECQDLNINLETQDGNLISLGYVKTSLNYGHDLAMDMQNRGKALVASGVQPEVHSPSMLHFIDNQVPEKLIKLNEESELTLFGTKILQESLSLDYNLTPNTFKSFLDKHGFHISGNKICRRRSRQCSNYDKYRSLDGSCNNPQHPQWGQSNSAFSRILPSRYSDGVHEMPISILGGDLPNPRQLSLKLFRRGKKEDQQFTLAVMQWGQILAHDFGRQVIDQTVNGGIECCMESGEGALPEVLQHHSCSPISISPRDKFYSAHGQRCMNFVRSMTVPSEDCTLGPAKLLNGATSYLDCSFLYGPDKLACDKLREFKGGRMKIEFRKGNWMLPKSDNKSQLICDAVSSEDFCYASGDTRTNQNPQLVILQTLLVREHNHLADGLAKINPHWTDEKLFQEARRILIAEYQHITYNEWLPILLGVDYCKSHGLIAGKNKTSDGYNPRVNPTTTLGFTSGAFRYLHTFIDGDIHFYTPKREVIGSTRLSNHYFRPRLIEEDDNFGYLLRGLTTQPLQASDAKIHHDITEYLFKSEKNFGMDLMALDIQRGRDHGIPGYNDYRRICRLKVAKDFEDLAEDISEDNLEKLRRAYAHVNDIDLIVGAALESKIQGSLLGPTNQCLIAEQFYRTRVGDRFFYDHQDSFTADQLKEIKKSTLAKLICDMGPAVSRIQRRAFESISSANPLARCEKMEGLNLEPWRD